MLTKQWFPARASRRALTVVASFEALKGLVVLLAAAGLLSLLDRDLNELGALLVQHTHLNPASTYPHIFLEAVSHLDQPRLLGLAAGAFAYALIRFAEAYGLFRQRLPSFVVRPVSVTQSAPTRALEILHSGLIGDYAAWVAVGVGVIAAVLAMV